MRSRRSRLARGAAVLAVAGVVGASPLRAQVMIRRRPAATQAPAAPSAAVAPATGAGAIVAGATWTPDRLDFGALWEGEAQRRTVRVTTPAEGWVTASLPADAPFRITEVRLMAPGAITGSDPTMAGRAAQARRTTAPWQVSATPGAEVQVDLEFRPVLDLFRMPAGPKAATLAIAGPASQGEWRATIPLTGTFKGKQLAPTFVITDGDFAADGSLQVVFSPMQDGSGNVGPKLVSVGVRLAAYDDLVAVGLSATGLPGTAQLADRCELGTSWKRTGQGPTLTPRADMQCTGQPTTLRSGEVRNSRVWLLLDPPDPTQVQPPARVSLVAHYEIANAPSPPCGGYRTIGCRAMAPATLTLLVVPTYISRALPSLQCGGLLLSGGGLQLDQKGRLTLRYYVDGTKDRTARFGVRFPAAGRTLLSLSATGAAPSGSGFGSMPPVARTAEEQLPLTVGWSFADFMRFAQSPAELACLS